MNFKKSVQLIFSGAGTTEKYSLALASMLNIPTQEVNLTAADKSAADLTFSPEDIVIIAVPSYGGRVPVPMVQKLQQLNGGNAAAILLCVYGNRAYDDTLRELYDVAMQRGFNVTAALAVLAQHSIMTSVAKGRPDAADTEKLTAFAAQIKTKLFAAQSTEELAIMRAVPGSFPYRVFNGVPFKPKANSACTECGICAKQCPVSAIPLESPSQTNNSACICCMRCVNVCPVHARALNAAVLAIAETAFALKNGTRKEPELYL